MMRTITTHDERPVFIPSDEGDLFGVLTRPPGNSNGIGVIFLLGGIYTLSINRNRLTVRLARRFASLGYHTLRLDVHGTGESAGRVGEYSLEKPFTTDVEAAARWLTAQGVDGVVLVGSCFGARTSLAASESIGSVRALGLLGLPVVRTDRIGTITALEHAQRSWGHVLRRAFRPAVLRRLIKSEVRPHYMKIARLKLTPTAGDARKTMESRTSPTVVRQLEQVSARGLPTLLLYGTEDAWREFSLARQGRLGDVLGAPHSPIELRHVDENLHGFGTIGSQDRAAQVLEDWLVRSASAVRATR